MASLKLTTHNGAKYVSSVAVAEYLDREPRYVSHGIKSYVATMNENRKLFGLDDASKDYLAVEGERVTSGVTPTIYLMTLKGALRYASTIRPKTASIDLAHEITKTFNREGE